MNIESKVRLRTLFRIQKTSRKPPESIFEDLRGSLSHHITHRLISKKIWWLLLSLLQDRLDSTRGRDSVQIADLQSKPMQTICPFPNSRRKKRSDVHKWGRVRSCRWSTDGPSLLPLRLIWLVMFSQRILIGKYFRNGL